MAQKNSQHYHDLIIEISSGMDYVKERLDAGSQRMKEAELRIRELEAWKNKSMGIAAIAAVVFSVLVNWLFRQIS